MPFVNFANVTLTEVDIADDNDLLDQFGTMIPVLVNENTNQHLQWPFTADQINKLLAQKINAKA